MLQIDAINVFLNSVLYDKSSVIEPWFKYKLMVFLGCFKSLTFISNVRSQQLCSLKFVQTLSPVKDKNFF
jgi:hypothetical protein